MALCEDLGNKRHVAWFSSSEWHLVFNKLYGENSNEQSKREAMDILHIWKLRTPFLHSGVEGTYIILKSMLLDRTTLRHYELSIILSTSMMRFLNLCAAYNKRQGTFFTTAIKMQLPRWLINLRHDAAHGQQLPPVQTLEKGLHYCFEWLYREYWLPVSHEIMDCVYGPGGFWEQNQELKDCLQPLISLFCNLSLVTHPNWGYQRIGDIHDDEGRNNVITDLKMLGFRSYTPINEVTIGKVCQFLMRSIENALDCEDLPNRNSVLADLLIEEGIFLGNFHGYGDVFIEIGAIPYSFLRVWEKLLKYMHKSLMLGSLIEKLLLVQASEEEQHEQRYLAALWLAEIGKALLKCNLIQQNLEELEAQLPDYENVNEGNILKMYDKMHESTKKVLNLSYLFKPPYVLTDCLQMKTLILDNPTKYTPLFLSELLEFNEFLKSDETKTRLTELVDLYVSERSRSVKIPEKVHTIEELVNSAMDVDDNVINIVTNEVPKNTMQNNEKKSKDVKKRWRRVTEVDFSNCPLGLLPWQSSEMNPLLSVST